MANRLKRLNLIIIAVAFMVTANFFNVKTVCGSSVVLTVISKNKIYNFNSYEVGYIGGKKTLFNLSEIVNGIYLDNYLKVTEPSLNFTPKNSKKFQVNPAKNGFEIDKTKLYNDIVYALNNGVKTVKCKVNTLYPTISESSLLSETFLRAKFTTYYQESATERVSNIKTSANYLNGTVVKKGEEFSFNNVVGERTESRGFLNAKIILDGEFVSGLGGGVCQVSTTAYNAIILAGLKVTERKPHSLTVSYVKPSFDAMVSYGYSDLKFINQTGGNVYISSYAKNNFITVEVYGKKNDSKFELLSIINEETPPPPAEEIISTDLYVGQTEVIQHAKNGVKSTGYLIEYSLTGERLKTHFLSNDTYKSVKQKIKIGVKPIELNDLENDKNL